MCPRTHNKARIYSNHFLSLDLSLSICTRKLGLINSKSISALISRLFQSGTKFCLYKHKYSQKVIYSINTTLICRTPYVPLSPLSNFVKIGQNGPKSDQHRSSFSAVPKYYHWVLSKSTVRSVPMTEVIMRKRLMFQYIPVCCNKIIQSFPRPHRWVYNVEKHYKWN